MLSWLKSFALNIAILFIIQEEKLCKNPWSMVNLILKIFEETQCSCGRKWSEQLPVPKSVAPEVHIRITAFVVNPLYTARTTTVNINSKNCVQRVDENPHNVTPKFLH